MPSLKFCRTVADDEKRELYPKRKFPSVDLSESPYSPEARETRRSSANAGKNKKRRPVTPRAPRKTSGEVTSKSWPQRRRQRRRPQRARRSNAGYFADMGKSKGALVCSAPILFAREGPRASRFTRSTRRPSGARSRPAGLTSVVIAPVIDCTGATSPDAPAAKTSIAAPLVTYAWSAGSISILFAEASVVAGPEIIRIGGTFPVA